MINECKVGMGPVASNAKGSVYTLVASMPLGLTSQPDCMPEPAALSILPSENGHRVGGKNMSDAKEDDVDQVNLDTRAKLEKLGYRTMHLSSSEIDELMRCVEKEKLSAEWRSKL